MNDSGADKKPTEKIKEVGENIADSLEPSEEDQATGGLDAPGASSPFSDGERPDEQASSDTPGGGLG